MINKVAGYMEQHQMIQKGGHICAGVSGGADSVCLFRILEQLRHHLDFTLSVVHIEHGIRGRESLSDLEFVKALAEKYGVAFDSYAYPVERIAKEEGLSVEEAGRKVRFEAYAAEAVRYGANTRIALAHHANDNVETMLFHLCRGSGIDGLMGILPVRENIIRPLLCVEREEIEAFLKEINQEYRTDTTNEDVRYSRNRIRKRVMPELVRVNEKTLAHMNRLAEDAAEFSAYLHDETDKILKDSMVKINGQTVEFLLAGFAQHAPILQKHALLALIAEACGSRKDISREHVNALRELAEGRTGRQISLPYGITAEKVYGKLILSPEKKEEHDTGGLPGVLLEKFPEELHFPMGMVRCRVFALSKKDIEIPKNRYTKWFDYDKIKNGLSFRTRMAGDYFVVDAKGHRQKLGDYWINEKVPKPKRGQILLLADGSHILWAVGYRISEFYKITEQTKNILEVQYVEENYE